ncbi:MAG: LPS export ABC transporter ATP-binding protein [Gammaproteobacteria bacterium]|nr:LPS export ABC transporter ATP-binding protein [Gammaproteobacteria bacterium]MCH9745048.1 LPS export ABC transporter ATP-binding protein [Gammaproteobacteria bacterium]
MPKLSIKHLEKRYKARKVVKNVSLHINQGEVVGLLGPNGAGKTTAFYMIIGLVTPDNGQVLLDDQNLTPLAMHKRARLGLGYLPQETSIFRKLTVSQNIMAILQLRQDLNKIQRQEKLDELLNEFHISHLKDVMAVSLSGGETRRVEIARALAMNPKFILLDEPFAGIDPISVTDIKEIITHLSTRNIGVLITDHNVRETLDICQRAYIVNEGTIISEGPPSEILKNKKVKEVYLGEGFIL